MEQLKKIIGLDNLLKVARAVVPGAMCIVFVPYTTRGKRGTLPRGYYLTSTKDVTTRRRALDEASYTFIENPLIAEYCGYLSAMKIRVIWEGILLEDASPVSYPGAYDRIYADFYRAILAIPEELRRWEAPMKKRQPFTGSPHYDQFRISAGSSEIIFIKDSHCDPNGSQQLARFLASCDPATLQPYVEEIIAKITSKSDIRAKRIRKVLGGEADVNAMLHLGLGFI